MRLWFAERSQQIKDLELVDTQATAVGRRVQKLQFALNDVLQFESVDASVQIKTYVNEARDTLQVCIDGQ
jgi:hypothetical protein